MELEAVLWELEALFEEDKEAVEDEEIEEVEAEEDGNAPRRIAVKGGVVMAPATAYTLISITVPRVSLAVSNTSTAASPWFFDSIAETRASVLSGQMSC